MPKNKDGYFRKTFTIGKDVDGKLKRVTVRGKTKREMEEKYNEAKRQHGLGLSMGEMTVYEWADRWFRVYKANASEGQKVQHRTKLNLDILPRFGSMYVRDVRASHLQEFINEYAGGKFETVKKIRLTLRQLFDDAELEGIIERNPARRLELPELTEKTRRPLTEFEKAVVYNVAQNHKHGAYVLTMLFCGLRRGECIALRVQDIDFENQRVVVNKSISFRGNKGTEKSTKTKAGIRVVPLPYILAPVLKRQCGDKATEDLVFAKSDGSLATQTAVLWWWNSFVRQCHIMAGAKLYRNQVQVETSSFSGEITPHYMKHTYASDLHAAGLEDRTIKHFLGHAPTDVTGVYVKIGEVAFKRAASLLNEYYSNLSFSLEVRAKNVPTKNLYL